MHTIVYLPIFLVFARAAIATLFTSPDQLPKQAYDFVVVGAGTAGSVIATRLSENSNFSVLLIEAGGNNAGLIETEVPLTAPGMLTEQALVWNYTTVPQSALNNRIIPYQRGRVLGGSSTTNFMLYTRGSRADYCRWATVTGDPGWSWDALLPFMLKAENFTPPVDHHNTSGQFDPSVHGFNGLLRTTVPGFPSEIDDRVIATTQADPENFPFNSDGNSGDTIGIGWAQSTSGGGERSSAATAYLQPVLNRPNLHVLINTQVTRILSSSSPRNSTVQALRPTPDLRKVELAQNSTSSRKTVLANNEVILSAGAINTPQLLLLSGIGDNEDLSALGIQSTIQSPGVGKNLQDHAAVARQWFVNSTATLDNISRNATLAQELLTQWNQTRTGQFTSVGENHLSWLRLPSNSTVFQGFEDPSAGPTSAHIELVPVDSFLSFVQPTPLNGSFITMVSNVASPASRGSLKLKTANPFDFPSIDPGFMTNPLDMAIMMEAFRVSDAFFATPPWKGYVLAPFGVSATAMTDEELEDFVRNNVNTFWHPSGTAKMGTREDGMAVVDSSLLLKGAEGVRVVDASIFPFIPAAHLQAAVYAVAERAASLIQSAWGI